MIKCTSCGSTNVSADSKWATCKDCGNLFAVPKENTEEKKSAVNENSIEDVKDNLAKLLASDPSDLDNISEPKSEQVQSLAAEKNTTGLSELSALPEIEVSTTDELPAQSQHVTPALPSLNEDESEMLPSLPIMSEEPAATSLPSLDAPLPDLSLGEEAPSIPAQEDLAAPEMVEEEERKLTGSDDAAASLRDLLAQTEASAESAPLATDEYSPEESGVRTGPLSRKQEKPMRMPSDEYLPLPDDSGISQSPAAPALTSDGRQMDGDIAEAVAAPVDNDAFTMPIGRVEEPQEDPHTERSPAFPPNPNIADPEDGPTMVQDFGADAANHKELEVADVAAAGRMNTDLPGIDIEHVACPVCGHEFAHDVSKGTTAICGECNTSFNYRSGELEQGEVDNSGSVPLHNTFIGRTIGACLIDGKLGEGGMGAVYHARQLSLDREVAIKILPPELTGQTNFMRRFEQEAKSLARINHPNILHIYDFGEDHETGVYYMIMEFVDGKDIADMLQELHHIDEIHTLELLHQAAAGLDAAASKGIIHRDVKPDNLMVESASNECKVMDFGLAKDSASVTQTNAKIRVGTPAFMSPEQCDGGKLDFRSDIYSLGVTGYVMLTGRLPYDGESPFAIMLKHKSEPIPSVRDRMKHISPATDAFIQKMMAKSASERFESWADVRNAIYDILTDLGSEVVDGLPKSEPRLPQMSMGLDDGGSFNDFANDLQSLPERPASPPPGAVGSAPAIPSIPTPPSPPPSPIEGAVSVEAAGLTLGEMAPRPQTGVNDDVDDDAIPDFVAPDPNAGKHVSNRMASVGAESGRNSTKTSARHRTGNSTRSASVSGRNGTGSGIRDQIQTNQYSTERLAVVLAKGDVAYQKGKLKQAIKHWNEYAAGTHDVRDRERCFEKLRMAQQELRSKFRRKLLVLFVLFIIGGALGIWQGLPSAHNYYADSEYAKLSSLEGEARVKALQEFVDTKYTRPFDWYAQVFQKTYEVTAYNHAIATIEKYQEKRAAEELLAQQRADLVELQRKHLDSSQPLPPIVAAAREMQMQIVDKEFLKEVVGFTELVAEELSSMESALTQIETALKAGSFVKAERLGQVFIEEHPRAGDLRMLVPTVVPITVKNDVGEALPEASILVNGIRNEDAQPHAFYYHDRPVQIRIELKGFIPFTETWEAVPEGSRKKPQSITLHPGRIWAQDITMKDIRWVDVHARSGYVLFHTPEMSTVVDSGSGEIIHALERSSLDSAAGSTEWGRFIRWEEEGRLVLSAMDGTLWEWDLVNTNSRRVFSTNSPILGVVAYEYTYRRGARAMVLAVDTMSGFGLRGFENGKENWQQQIGRQQNPPLLFHKQALLFALDDAGLRVYEEDGKRRAMLTLSGGNRIGEAIWIDADRLLVPSTAGLELFQFDDDGNISPLIALRMEEGELSLPPATHGSSVAVVTNDKKLHVYNLEIQNGSVKRLAEAWVSPLSSDRAAPFGPAMNDRVVVISDATGTLEVFDRVTGDLMRVYEHGSPLIARPIISGSRLLVLDQEHQVSAYQVPQ